MNGKKTITVYLEKTATEKYRVVRTKNTLDPKVNSYLSKEEVESLLSSPGIEVIVDPPRR